MKVKLTQTMITSLPIPDKRMFFRDSVILGLTLRVGVTGKKAWYLDYRINGKRKWWSIGNAEYITLAEARQEAQAFLGVIARGEDPLAVPAPSMTLKFLRETHYEPWVTAHRKSGDETIKGIKRYFAVFDDLEVEKLTLSDIELWRQKMKHENHLKAATINRGATYLTAMLNWAAARKLIKVNPLGKLEKLKETDSKKKWRFLTKDEIKILAAALIEREVDVRAGEAHCLYDEPFNGEFADPLRPMVLVALNTGIRWGSLVSLRWENIDLTNQMMYLDPGNTKAESSQTIPLNSTATDVLTKWKSQLPDSSAEALVFPAPKGGMFYNVNKVWRKVLKDSTLGHLRWHDLRHTFASQLVMAGIPLNTVRELLGHKDIKTTLRYAHLAPQGLKSAVESLS